MVIVNGLLITLRVRDDENIEMEIGKVWGEDKTNGSAYEYLNVRDDG